MPRYRRRGRCPRRRCRACRRCGRPRTRRIRGGDAVGICHQPRQAVSPAAMRRCRCRGRCRRRRCRACRRCAKRRAPRCSGRRRRLRCATNLAKRRRPAAMPPYRCRGRCRRRRRPAGRRYGKRRDRRAGRRDPPGTRHQPRQGIAGLPRRRVTPWSVPAANTSSLSALRETPLTSGSVTEELRRGIHRKVRCRYCTRRSRF